MPNFDLKFVSKPALDAMRDIEKRTDKATMWALRQVGREIKKEARKRAPVYKKLEFNRQTGRVEVSKSVLTGTQFKKFQKATGYRGSISNNVVISGLLKNSISSSRRLQSPKTGQWALKVGPRGQRVHLYAQKIEDQVWPYMHHALEVVEPKIVAIHAKAWESAMRPKK